MDLSSLNENQYRGVVSDSQYIRVVAGAGSGKTRVLTYRIAHLILEKNVPASQIMGVTFTNKAAKEIKDRTISLIEESRTEDDYYDFGINYNRLFLGTIHSWCARFLRHEAEYIGYPKSFTILDDEDQLGIMKSIFHDRHDLPKSDPNIKACLEWIGKKKTEGLEYEDIKDTEYPNQQMRDFLSYFGEYTEILKERHSLDFDDLLLKSIDILEDKSNGVRERYTKYAGHILVDEFQDINDVQFHLITLLMNKNTNLYVVGDPDQTIYTWRGANHRLIMEYEENLKQMYPRASVETIILNQNYRSTKSILDCSNKLIDNNKERVRKELFSNQSKGDDVSFFNARTIKEEAMHVVTTILDLHRKEGVEYKNIAVLYRANYLSREIETTLSMYRLPYKVFGGMKFYQRKEIKDVVAYFRLMVNEFDDTSFERIVNVPKRSIGPGTYEKLQKESDSLGQTIFLYVKENLNDCPLSAKQRASISCMITEMGKVMDKVNAGERSLSQTLEDFLENIGYFKYLEEEEDNGDEREENVKELLTYVDAFLADDPAMTFDDFINNAMLQSSQDDVNDGNFISLMTVHTAKGLEYDYVFVYGMGEGVFPSIRSVSESKMGLEEERRLAYVAFTRARKRLYVSANQDYNFMMQTNLRPSRFVKEAGLYRDDYKSSFLNGGHSSYGGSSSAGRTMYRAPGFERKDVQAHVVVSANQNNGVTSWKVGDRCEHITYGKGTVKEVIQKLIVIQFDDVSIPKKTFLGSHIAIKKLEDHKGEN